MTSSQSKGRSYEEAVEKISSYIVVGRTGHREGTLKDISKACRLLGIDLVAFKAIHIAGTKGKGSTASFTERILREGGVRTGLFTSPHLVDVRERVRINGAVLNKDTFSRHFWAVQDVISNQDLQLHYFHFLTILGFYIFDQEKVEAAVIEVGLGGRWDSTNVLPAPVVCGVTLLDLDHVAILGDTIAKIAAEKAGIFKPQVPAVMIHSQHPEGVPVLESEAERKSCPLFNADKLDSYYQSASIDLGLDGDFQKDNAALALALTRCWWARTGTKAKAEKDDWTATCQNTWSSKLGIKLWTGQSSPDCESSPGSLKGVQASPVFPLADFEKAALAATCWPGRAQFLKKALGHSSIHLDGGHTIASLRSCGAWFREKAIQAEQAVPDQQRMKVLLFNTTGGRSADTLLHPLVSLEDAQGSRLFDVVVFMPLDSSLEKLPTVSKNECSNSENVAVADKSLYSWQYKLLEAWCEEMQKLYGAGSVDDGREHLPQTAKQIKAELEAIQPGGKQVARVAFSLGQALEGLQLLDSEAGKDQLDVLCTGSLYLVGDVLSHIASDSVLDL